MSMVELKGRLRSHQVVGRVVFLILTTLYLLFLLSVKVSFLSTDFPFMVSLTGKNKDEPHMYEGCCELK